ncbi:MAG TPA: Ig-like domain-containing protein [Polyangia bacterium]|nr:Ig-like domain-containing protein [Polyangia bacterium]
MTIQPGDGASDVALDLPIKLVFRDYPDPDTVEYSGVILTTGVYYHGGIFRVDLIDKAITLSPSGGLRPELGYNLNILPGLESLRGCAAEMRQYSFQAGNQNVGLPPTAPAATFADVDAIFARTCAGGACHRASDGGCLPAPAAGLSLCTRDARAATIDVPSGQVSRLMLVAPSDSSRSYLLRKLLPGATPDVPAPTALGHRDPPGAPLTNAELHAIASWIDAGGKP